MTILFDGIAYGMLLFVLACGLSVTLGLMNFINLAHGAFAMAGGYITVVLVNRLGVPFLLGLPLAFLFGAALGAVLGRYRLMIIVICGLLTVALQFILASTRFGSRLRAAVDDQRVARGLGINVGAVFGLTFAFGSGLAALGGALGAEILGLDPNFPLKYLIYFLIVVTVGGTSSITGPFVASILLGIGDVMGKYYVPTLSAFVIYSIMIVMLLWRPQGLFARASAR